MEIIIIEDIMVILKRKQNEKQKNKTLIQIIRMCNQDIEIEFVIEKCAMIVIKRAKRKTVKGIGLSKY